MAELTLYHAAPSRSSVVRWMLEEVGEPYDIHVLSLKKGENRQPAKPLEGHLGDRDHRGGAATGIELQVRQRIGTAERIGEADSEFTAPRVASLRTPVGDAR